MDRGQQRSRAGACSGTTPAKGAAIGLLIIAVGVVLLLNNFGVVEARHFWDYVPLILVFAGVMRIIESNGRTSGLLVGGVLMAAGAFWFVNNMGWFRLDGRLIFPGIVIGLGVLLLVRAIDRSSGSGAAMPQSRDLASVLNEWVLFGGIKRHITAPDFRGGDLFALFGGIDIDMRRAGMLGEEAAVDATAIFGGVDLKVPANWTVVMRGQGIFGGYEDKTLPSSNAQDSPHRLVVTGLALFGGVSVKN